MDQVNAPDESFGNRSARKDREAHILPSRLQARSALEAVLQEEDGPALLTGDAGVGKTWLHRQFRSTFAESYRWLEVDLTAAVEPMEFQRLILQGFGYDESAGLAEARGLIADLLVDASASSERWVLVIEEAHNASPAILEETRILGNRLGSSDGFAGILLVGQNSLIRRLTTKPNRPIASRLAARVHLRPLTLDEFEEWVRGIDAEPAISSKDIEQFHRAVSGNPRRYLVETRQAWKPRTALDRAEPANKENAAELAEDATESKEVAALTSWEVPPVLPRKPPLHVADDMIEVGWDANAELPAQDDEYEGEAHEGLSSRSEPGNGKEHSEERINDHYAALQAWTEWAQNQGREPVSSGILAEKIDVAEHDPEGFDPLPDEESRWAAPAPVSGELRSESQHTFAPYSQLFSRLKEPRESAS